MTDDKTGTSTQRTPEGAERERLRLRGKGGTDIPVPTREQVMGDFAKIVKARPDLPSRRRVRGPKE